MLAFRWNGTSLISVRLWFESWRYELEIRPRIVDRGSRRSLISIATRKHRDACTRAKLVLSSLRLFSHTCVYACRARMSTCSHLVHPCMRNRDLRCVCTSRDRSIANGDSVARQIIETAGTCASHNVNNSSSMPSFPFSA